MAEKKSDPMIMAILAKHKPPEMGGEGGEPEDGGADEGLSAAAGEALSAIEAKDAEALKGALLNFFNIADSMPHEEGPHAESEE